MPGSGELVAERPATRKSWAWDAICPHPSSTAQHNQFNRADNITTTRGVPRRNHTSPPYGGARLGQPRSARMRIAGCHRPCYCSLWRSKKPHDWVHDRILQAQLFTTGFVPHVYRIIYKTPQGPLLPSLPSVKILRRRGWRPMCLFFTKRTKETKNSVVRTSRLLPLGVACAQRMALPHPVSKPSALSWNCTSAHCPLQGQ